MLGRQLEARLTWLGYITLTLGAGIASTEGELLGSDISGIGLSGILFGFFGYLLVRGWWDPVFAKVISKRTTWLMLGWLIVCIVLTRLEVLRVGNFAHAAGLVWGSVAGILPKFRQAWLRWSVPLILLLPLLIWFIYAPWTKSWLSKKAYDLHDERKVTEAMVYYDRILERYPDDEFAQVNSGILRRYMVEKEVHTAIVGKQYHEAAQLCRQMLRKDSSDSYASSMLKIAVADSLYQATWHRP